MARGSILVVDDESGARFGIRSFLESHGYEVQEAGTCQAAEREFSSVLPDAAIVDYLLPDGNAVELLPRLKRLGPEIPVLILTAHGSIELAVSAIQNGADQFLTKPVELQALLVVLERLLENQRNRRKQLAGRSGRSSAVIDPFRGSSEAIRGLEEQVRRVLPSDSPVLIQGETGSGKGVLASWLHHCGPRSDESFVDLNCAGIKREFLESELFGHAKGSFTGADANKSGLLEIAHRGTVFLDEIGDMDPAVQARVLKVLDEQRFRRLGEVRDRRVDIRLIAATHQDLARLVRDNRFRKDLYYRINAIPLRVPALRERVEDIPLLARFLLEDVSQDLGRGVPELLRDAEAALQAYAWPGNIRELRNVLERAALHGAGSSIGAGDLRFGRPIPGGSPTFDSGELTLREVEKRHIARVLAEEGGHVERSARRLGISRTSLYQRIRRYGIERGG